MFDNMPLTKVLAILLTAHQAASQDYSVVPKWADFGLYGDLGFQDLDFKLEFIMDHYEIVSIEKCTGNGGGSTVRLANVFSRAANDPSVSQSQSIIVYPY